MSENPFAVFTPEGLDAQKVVSIFSTAMPGLGSIETAGHAFVMGTRGSGKSILFRYLEPDCQYLVTGKKLHKLPYVALYVSFRETEAQVSELARFDDKHGQVFFNEHLLVLAICARITSRLLRNNVLDDEELAPSTLALFDEVNCQLGGEPTANGLTLNGALRSISTKFQKSYRSSIQYVKQHAFRSTVLAYDGDLFGFDDLLLPYIDFLRSALRLADETPVLLLLDDADSLTMTQTRIVNSWVARRLSLRCSLKIAAQVTAYKTMVTIHDSRIEAPHDYQEIDLSDFSTKSSEKSYRNRIANIVQQRLKTVGVIKSAEKYFPEDHSQKLAIAREARRLSQLWDAGSGRGYRARDDVQRYARPNYITDLGGPRKSRSKYSYSGFDQLVHLSSGVTRFFLEAAADMYAQAYSEMPAGNRNVTEIDARIQNTVVRDHASRQMITAIQDLEKDTERLYGTPKLAVQLNNLIRGLGALFEMALTDKKAAERKFFSFAMTDEPAKDIQDVLNLGMRYGYFFQSIIGRKEGFGRAPLYILSRRLAPLFNLDPMGFSAYKFLTNEKIRLLMDYPEETRRLFRRTRNADIAIEQISLDFGPQELENG
jgi:hypothetical protein